MIVCVTAIAAPDSMPPAMDSPAMDAGAPPVSQSGGGDIGFFSQDLGTILRLKYTTESYGQDGTGNERDACEPQQRRHVAPSSMEGPAVTLRS